MCNPGPTPGGQANAYLVWTNLGPIAAGQNLPLTYDVLVPDTVGPSETLVNEAGVRRYESLNGVELVPADNIDTTNTVTNAPAADDTAEVATPALQIVKRIPDPSTYQVGQTFTYFVDVTIPRGVTVYNGQVTDAPVAGLTYVAGTSAVNLAGWTVNDAAPLVASTASYTNSSGADEILTLSFNVLIDNAWAPGDTVPNTASLAYEDSNGGSHGADSETVEVDIIAPFLELEKGTATCPDETVPGDECSAEPGDTVTYQLTIDNSGTGTAHDIDLTDVLPLPYPASSVTNISGGGVYDAATMTITWSALGPIAAGDTLVLTYDVELAPSSLFVPGGVGPYTNTADIGDYFGLPEDIRDMLDPDDYPTYDGPSDTYDTVVLVPLPSIIKSAPDPAVADIGEAVTFTLEVSNDATAGTAFDLDITDQLPAGWTYVVGSTTVGGIADADPDATTGLITWVDLVPTLAPGATVVITFDAIAGPELGDPSTTGPAVGYTDTAGVQAEDATGFDDYTDSDEATVTLTQPLLSIDKDVSCDATANDATDTDACTIDVGDALTFTVTVTNDGDGPAYSIAVLDTLPATTPPFGPPTAITGGGIYDAVAGTISWTVPGPLAAGDSVSFTYDLVVGPSEALASLEAPYINSAEIPEYFGISEDDQAENPDVGPYDPPEPDDVTLGPLFPEVTVAKSALGVPDGAGGYDGGPPLITDANPAAFAQTPFGWQIVVESVGDIDALNVDVLDTLPPGWTYVPASSTLSVSGGAPAPLAEPTITGSDLVWDNVGNLPPGDTFTIVFEAYPPTYAYLVANGIDPQYVNTANVVAEDANGSTGNGAGPYGSDPDDDPNDPDNEDSPGTAAVSLPVIDLELDKALIAPTEGPYLAGTVLTYQITITNQGPDTATNVTALDELPVQVAYVAHTASVGTWDPVTGEWVIGTIAAGDTVTLTIDAEIVTEDLIVNDAEVTSHDQIDIDSTPSNQDSADEDDNDTLEVFGPADVSIDKSHVGDFVVGFVNTWTVTVSNAGPSSAFGVVVSDTIPAGLDIQAVNVGPDWTCTVTGQDIDCVLAGFLDEGASATIEIDVFVNPEAATSVDNTATVDTESFDPDPSNNSDVDTVDIPFAVLGLEKAVLTDPFVNGQEADYEMVVTNYGPSPTSGGLTVVDTLPTGLTYVSGGGNGWTCAAAGQVVTCTNPLDLAAGESSTLAMTALIDAAPGDELVNVAEAAGGPAIDPSGLDLSPDGPNGDGSPLDVSIEDGQIIFTGDVDSLSDGMRSNLGIPAGTTLDDDAAGVVVAPPPALAFTGSSPARLAMVGLVLVGIGGALVVGRRNRFLQLS